MAKKEGDEDKLPIPSVALRDAKSYRNDGYDDDGCDAEADDDAAQAIVMLA